MKTRSKFEQWQDNNCAKIKPYKKHIWLGLFAFTVIIIAIPSAIGLYCFFTLSTTPISVTQPANVWLLVMMSNVISRPFFLGFFACYCWLAYRKEVAKESVTSLGQKGEMECGKQ